MPRPFRAYFLSLAALVPVDCVLYWLDVGMGWWIFIMGCVAAIGATVTLNELLAYLRPPDPRPLTSDLRSPSSDPRPPIDLTPAEFRQPVAPANTVGTGDETDDFDPDPGSTYPHAARSTRTPTTTYPRTLSL